jgi:hypothetical protein
MERILVVSAKLVGQGIGELALNANVWKWCHAKLLSTLRYTTCQLMC